MHRSFLGYQNFMAGLGSVAAEVAAGYALKRGLEYAFSPSGEPAPKRRQQSRKMNPYAQTPTLNKMLLQGARRQARKQYLAANRRTGGFAGIENKFFDNAQAPFSMVANTWATHANFTTPAEGSGPTERSGRTCFIRSVHIRGKLVCGGSAVATIPGDVLVRMVLVWDTQTNNAALTPANVYEPGQTIMQEFRNLEYTSRFIVLKEKVIRIRPDYEWNGTNYAVMLTEVPFKFNKTFKKPIKVRFSETTAAIGSVADNSIQFMFAREANTSNPPSITFESRCRFSDTV